MAAGEIIPAIALTEPGGGSDAANLQLRARRDGDAYVLDGEKTSTTFATQAASPSCGRGPAGSGARGISAFLVPLDAAGIATSEFEDVGGRAAGRGWVHSRRRRIPAPPGSAPRAHGFVQVMQGFDYSRALIGLQCLAVARQSLDETWRVGGGAHELRQAAQRAPGRVVPARRAETHVDACRLLCLQTLWLKDQGLPHTAEAAMCKWWGPKLAFEVVQTCLLIHGHGAYTAELPYEQRLRDVLGLQIGDGPRRS